jgi:SWI/SNF-related matrix-associated actin-dependent regulator of chromatin subfamily A3
MFWQCKAVSLCERIPMLTVVQVINVKAQLRSVDRLDQYNSWSRDSAQSFAVVQEGDYFALEYEGHKFARLNKRFCRDLHALVTSERQVRIQAYVPKKDWTTVVQSWRTQSSAPFPVEINLYGTRADAEEVGSILSKSGTFLQSPHFGLDGAEYHNPHFLQIEGYSDEIPIETPLSPRGNVPETRDQAEEEESQVNDSAEFNSILNSGLLHHSTSQEILVDGRIKTELLQ